MTETKRKISPEFKRGDLVTIDPVGDSFGNQPVWMFRFQQSVNLVNLNDWFYQDQEPLKTIPSKNFTGVLEIIRINSTRVALLWSPEYQGYEHCNVDWLKYYNVQDA